MGEDDRVERGYACAGKHGFHRVKVLLEAGIHKKSAGIRLKQQRVAFAGVDEKNAQHGAPAFPGRRGGGRFAAFRHGGRGDIRSWRQFGLRAA